MWFELSQSVVKNKLECPKEILYYYYLHLTLFVVLFVVNVRCTPDYDEVLSVHNGGCILGERCQGGYMNGNECTCVNRCFFLT